MRKLLTSVMLLVICIPAVAQFSITNTMKEELVIKAHDQVNLYHGALQAVGSAALESYEKEPFMRDIYPRFESRQARVVNDIDPTGREGKDMPIDVYLGSIVNSYSENGLTFDAEIRSDLSNGVYMDSKGAAFLFVKVVVQKKISGMSDYSGQLDYSALQDVYVKYFINGGTLDPTAYIYAIVPHDANVTSYNPVTITGTPPGHRPVPAPAEVRNTAIPPRPKAVPSANVEGCTDPDSPPVFKGTGSGHKDEWKAYHRNHHDWFVRPVAQGLDCQITVSFMVNADGSIDGESLSFTPGSCNDNERSENERAEHLARQLVMESARHVHGWMPAKRSCRSEASRTSVNIVFRKGLPPVVLSDAGSTTATAIPCEEADSGPKFQSAAGLTWVQFCQQDSKYRQATANGLNGSAETTFIVTKEGKVDLSSVKTQFQDVGDRQNALANSLVLHLLEQSGTQWAVAKKQCRPAPSSITMSVHFEQRKGANTTSTSVASCEGRNIPPLFRADTRKGHDKAWKNYVRSHPQIAKAVWVDGVRGLMDVNFKVGLDGSIDRSSLRMQFGRSLNSPAIAETAAEQVILQSPEKGNGWTPGTRNCRMEEKVASVRFRFSKGIINPTPVIDSPFLSQEEEKKLSKKAKWMNWRDNEKKKGGVHFSFGAMSMLFLREQEKSKYDDQGNVTGTRKNLPMFIGGEAAFGGLFGHVGGLEAKYGIGWDVNEGSVIHRGSLGVIFNASPRRWPARFYFPIHVGAIFLPNKHVMVQNERNVLFEIKAGVLCLDIKMDKYSSFYMELLSASFTSDLRWSESLRFTYTPSIGFRFCRW